MSNTRSLTDLEQTDAFLRRHIGPDDAEQQAMLETLGVESLDALITETVPGSITSITRSWSRRDDAVTKNTSSRKRMSTIAAMGRIGALRDRVDAAKLIAHLRLRCPRV